MVVRPKFAPGQRIRHNKFDYRGVIVDVDPSYAGSEDWYEEVARSRPRKDRPWYHVLVHGAQHQTYVAERHLEVDESDSPVEHPMLAIYFDEFHDGMYVRTRTMN